MFFINRVVNEQLSSLFHRLLLRQTVFYFADYYNIMNETTIRTAPTIITICPLFLSFLTSHYLFLPSRRQASSVHHMYSYISHIIKYIKIMFSRKICCSSYNNNNQTYQKHHKSHKWQYTISSISFIIVKIYFKTYLVDKK